VTVTWVVMVWLSFFAVGGGMWGWSWSDCHFLAVKVRLVEGDLVFTAIFCGKSEVSVW
jgi:hypothetical protein